MVDYGMQAAKSDEDYEDLYIQLENVLASVPCGMSKPTRRVMYIAVPGAQSVLYKTTEQKSQFLTTSDCSLTYGNVNQYALMV